MQRDAISCKDEHNKGQKDMDPTEEEDIKKRWYSGDIQKNWTKKIFMTWITTMVWSLT